MFSTRLPAELSTNAVTRALERMKADGESWLDLTETNPTRVGLSYPHDLLSGLSTPAALVYAPEPRGLASARAAVAAEYLRQGLAVSADRIVLTASTSEAYAILFKLLCDPGDAVLVPQPSYPLFDLLTQLEGVETRPYRLEYHGAWWIDRSSLEAALTSCTRAVLVVSPNNPTGSMLRAADREWLLDLCASHGLALIGDEVFADYPLARRSDATSVIGDDRALCFSLGGLSKSAGLPQVKLGWMAVGGPDVLVDEALARLDVICDTYLSVGTPVQAAAGQLIESGRVIRAAIASRLNANVQHLEAVVRRAPATTLLAPEGGWSAVIRVPAVESEEALVLRLLTEAHVLVHPGYFFDFPTEAFLVVSLLPEPSRFVEAIARVFAALERSPS